jgi:predicted dehydrogenase
MRSVQGIDVVGICTSRKETAEAAAKRFGVARPFWDAETMATE